MINLSFCFIWAFLISVFAIPSIINVAHLKQLLDEPNLRTVHLSLTPRLGGIAIFAGFASSMTIFGDFNKEIQQIIAGCIVLFFIGLKDDIVSVSPFKKFFVQVLATGIVIFIGDIRITSFQGIFGLYDLPVGISYAFTGLVIVGITNAFNLIDGLDGLAGAIVVFATFIFGIFFFLNGSFISTTYAYVSFCLLGGVMGFLRFNIRKAIIFMGDTGSLVCGFIVAVLAIKFIELKPLPSSPAVAISILAIPILDTLRVFIIRIYKGRSPFSPDKNHIHHIFRSWGITPFRTLTLIISINVIFFAVTYFLLGIDINILILIEVAMALVLSYVLQLKRDKTKQMQ
ncbi:MAG: MraY family glycosyltransferase [Bacteroidota bacterium]|nr:MraY family glycosyltransferase [Bacteroidota bacterium]